MPQHPLHVVLYADQKSLVDFTQAEESAIVKSYRRIFNEKVKFRYVDAADVRSGRAFKDDPHEFILPGIFGETCHYADHLGEKGNDNIRSFVRGGKNFSGYCAGAFYGTQTTYYNPIWGKSKQRGPDTNLAVLPVDGIGPVGTYCQPVSEPRSQFPVGLYRVDPVPIVLRDDSIVHMAYGFGPAFRIAANSDVRVIGRYAGIKGRPPAIVEGPYGKGHVTLYGVLPQYQVDTKPNALIERPKSTRRLMETLYESRDELAAFSHRQLNRMAAQHGLYL